VNSLARLMRILDQFEAAPGILTADQLHERLGYSRSTLYRYLKALSDNGFIVSLHGNGFSLGPRIIELCSALTARDPLILSSTPVMQDLAREFKGMVSLHRRFRERVVCVHRTADAVFAKGFDHAGRVLSLTDGAAGRVVLAHLCSASVRKLYQARPHSFDAAGLGSGLPAVRQTLRQIRDRGYDVDWCHDADGPVMVAAPILDQTAVGIGSLCLTMPSHEISGDRILGVAEQVIDCTEVIGYALNG